MPGNDEVEARVIADQVECGAAGLRCLTIVMNLASVRVPPR